MVGRRFAADGHLAAATPKGDTLKQPATVSIGDNRTPFARLNLEPMTGIEPAFSAWEADVLPLNYIGAIDRKG